MVDGQTFEEVRNQLVAHRTKINGYLANLGSIGSPTATRRIDAVSMLTLSDASSFREMDYVNEKDNNYPTFSLVINGQSLVHALRPDLELLFLGVAEHCNGKFFQTKLKKCCFSQKVNIKCRLPWNRRICHRYRHPKKKQTKESSLIFQKKASGNGPLLHVYWIL